MTLQTSTIIDQPIKTVGQKAVLETHDCLSRGRIDLTIKSCQAQGTLIHKE